MSVDKHISNLLKSFRKAFGNKKREAKVIKHPKVTKFTTITVKEARSLDRKVKSEIESLRAEVAYWRKKYKELERELQRIKMQILPSPPPSLEDARARKLVRKLAKRDYERFKSNYISIRKLLEMAEKGYVRLYSVDHKSLGYLHDFAIMVDPVARFAIVARTDKDPNKGKKYVVAQASRIDDLIHRPENVEIIKDGVMILQRTWDGDVEPYESRIFVEIDEEQLVEAVRVLAEEVGKWDLSGRIDAYEVIEEYTLKKLKEGEAPDKISRELSKKLFNADIQVPAVREIVYSVASKGKSESVEKVEEESAEEDVQDEKVEVETEKFDLPKLGDEDIEDIDLKIEGDKIEKRGTPMRAPEVKEVEESEAEEGGEEEVTEEAVDALLNELAGEGGE